jgi:hypothetical protein
MNRTVLVVRATGAVAIIAAYAVFRLPTLTSPWEAAASWVGAVVLGGLALRSIEMLAVLTRDRLEPGEPSVLELTDVLPTSVPRTPVTMLDDTDRFRIHGDLFADTIAFEQGRAKLVDRGEFVEPQLFTHEFHPATPARGMEIVPSPGVDPATRAKLKKHFIEAITSGRHAKVRSDNEDAIAYATTETTGRHALADAQLNRERAHGQFGVW